MNMWLKEGEKNSTPRGHGHLEICRSLQRKDRVIRHSTTSFTSWQLSWCRYVCWSTMNIHPEDQTKTNGTRYGILCRSVIQGNCNWPLKLAASSKHYDLMYIFNLSHPRPTTVRFTYTRILRTVPRTECHAIYVIAAKGNHIFTHVTSHEKYDKKRGCIAEAPTSTWGCRRSFMTGTIERTSRWYSLNACFSSL